MTNKTITISRELLDAAATAVGEWGDSLLSRCNPGYGTAMLDLERELRDVLNADPVPPAGGEPDFPEYRDLDVHPVADIEYQRDVGYNQALADTRPIVTRLQAEVKRLELLVAQYDYNADAAAIERELVADGSGVPVAWIAESSEPAFYLSGSESTASAVAEHYREKGFEASVAPLYRRPAEQPAPVAAVKS